METNRAKELFFIFNGNEFFMWKDGYLDEYNSYKVSDEEKLIWRRELIEKLYSQLEVKHESTLSGLCGIINFFGDPELLEKILNYISANYTEADSFLKIRYAENLFDIMEKSELHDIYPPDLLIKTKTLAFTIINEVLINNIEINDESTKILEFNQELKNEDYLIERGKNLLKQLNSFRITQ